MKQRKFRIGDIILTKSGNKWKKTGSNEWTCILGECTWNTGDIVKQGDEFISSRDSRVINNFETYVEQANRLVSEGVN